jgi:hypothetical protein
MVMVMVMVMPAIQLADVSAGSVGESNLLTTLPKRSLRFVTNVTKDRDANQSTNENGFAIDDSSLLPTLTR